MEREAAIDAHLVRVAGAQPPDPAAPAPAQPLQAESVALDDRLLELESNLIMWALKVSHGNKSRAAELLQIKRSTLGDRIARCGLGRAPQAEERRPTRAAAADSTV